MTQWMRRVTSDSHRSFLVRGKTILSPPECTGLEAVYDTDLYLAEWSCLHHIYSQAKKLPGATVQHLMSNPLLDKPGSCYGVSLGYGPKCYGRSMDMRSSHSTALWPQLSKVPGTVQSYCQSAGLSHEESWSHDNYK